MPEPNTNKILDCIEEENEEWEIIPLEMEVRKALINESYLTLDHIFYRKKMESLMEPIMAYFHQWM